MIQTKGNRDVGIDYNRLVKGDRGDYYEFTRDQIILENLHIPENARWRISDEWKDRVYYVEYRTIDNVKVYAQRRYVGYADYRLYHFYIAKEDILII